MLYNTKIRQREKLLSGRQRHSETTGRSEREPFDSNERQYRDNSVLHREPHGFLFQRKDRRKLPYNLNIIF